MQTEIAILIGAGLATVGWIYTARRARMLARKQHTINVILQTNFSERFLNSRSKIAPYLKKCECPDEIMNGENEELRAHFRDILNHYEFVSAGMRNGDFDERLLKDSEKSTYIALYKCCEPYIWSLRNNRNRMSIYEHLEWVHSRWETNKPNKFVRAIERVRDKPFYGKLDQERK
ncbi:DUF4760 domain-containing protein [Roseibium sp.]|uniref:DUF4760 domain-containing protein n=1 Tax=Roseibium sp. TaxID=1936156 RepID=UPI003D0ADACF